MGLCFMSNERSLRIDSSASLSFRSVYRFEQVEAGLLDYVVLRGDGTVGGGSRESEQRWEMDGTALRLMTANNVPTSNLRYVAGINTFVPADRNGSMLIPVLTLLSQRVGLAKTPAVFVNTIPKSGTYLLERALREVGSQSLRLHLSSHFYDDNRQLADEREFHTRPIDRRVPCPAQHVAMLMQEGEHVVGHIDSVKTMKAVIASGVTVISCIRDLRDVLVSLFHFKQVQVAPLSAADRIWRTARDPRDRFIAFLAYSEQTEIKHLLLTARVQSQCPGIIVKFEDMVQGKLSNAAVAQLNAVRTKFGSNLARGLAKSVGKETSTLSRNPATYRDYWSDEIESYFVDTGLAEANRSLGYIDK